MNKVNSRFHIENGRLIKTSNGEPIPQEEPVIILRGRDHLALPLMEHYREMCVKDGCNDYFLEEVDKSIEEFRQFKIQYYNRMKQPGVTKGL